MLCGVKRRPEEEMGAIRVLTKKPRCLSDEPSSPVFQRVSAPDSCMSMEIVESSSNKQENNDQCLFAPTVRRGCVRCEAGEPGHIRHILC